MADLYQIVVPDWLSPPADVEERVFEGVGEVRLLQRTRAEECTAELAAADGILLWHCLALRRPAIEGLRRCRVIVRCGVGFDSVDLHAAAERGIPVCNVPDYGTEEVADHTLGLYLALSRGIVARHEEVSAGEWDVRCGDPPLHRNRGRTFGIVGLGRIGAATALRAKALGLKVVFYDPYVPDGRDKSLGVERASSLEDLAAASDVVSLHVPLTEETRGMIGEAFFAAVRPESILLNTCRGEVVDGAAFGKAFSERRVFGGGFDVLPVEPPDETLGFVSALRSGDPSAHARLVLTPHSAFYTEESLTELREKAALEALRVLSGQAPRNCVNGHLLPG